MSVPISSCDIAQACINEEAYQALFKSMTVNLKYGHYSVRHGPCPHTPHCPIPTNEQVEALNERMTADMAARIMPKW